MTRDRPAIPTRLRRQVLVEAGHRCSIPTCRQTTTEIAHIIPWKDVKEHTFENLIALCPNCHSRYDKGEIDRKAMQQYKINLAVLNDRYSEIERRVLRYFHDNPKARGIKLDSSFDFLLMNAIQDGLVSRLRTSKLRIEGLPVHVVYTITDKGSELIKKWFGGEQLD